MLPERGGDQGDYRAGIRAKINNAIECLKSEPLSKRAVSELVRQTASALDNVTCAHGDVAAVGDTHSIQLARQRDS